MKRARSDPTSRRTELAARLAAVARGHAAAFAGAACDAADSRACAGHVLDLDAVGHTASNCACRLWPWAGLAVAGLLLVGLLARAPRPGPLVSGRRPRRPHIEPEVRTCALLCLVTPGAHRVALAGDSTAGIRATPCSRTPMARWHLRGPICGCRGLRNEYMFVVDGQWVPDPSAPAPHSRRFSGAPNSVLWL